MFDLQWRPIMPAWWILGLAVAVCVWTAVAYRRSALPPRRQWLLTTLRSCALLALATIAFRPTLQRTAPGEAMPRVAIVIDDSASMATLDTRSPPELVRLAEALGLIDPVLRDRPGRRLYDALIDAQRSLRDPDRVAVANAEPPTLPGELEKLRALAAADPSTTDLATRLTQLAGKLQSHAQPRELRRELESIGEEIRRREARFDDQLVQNNPSVRTATEGLGRRSRFDLARQAALALRARLQGRANVRFHSLAGPLTDAELGQRDAAGAASPLMAALKPAAADNDAVVLLTDGRSTEPHPIVPAAVAASGTMVLPVLASPRRIESSVRLLRIDAPPQAIAGERVAVRVVLRSTLAQGRSAQVQVAGGDTVLTRDVPLTGGDDTATFVLTAGGATEMRVTATVAPLQGTRAAEGTMAVDVRLLPRSVRVLALIDRASADSAAAIDSLASSGWCKIETPNGATPSADAIANADLIVLDDAAAALLNDATAAAIMKQVTAESKSILFIPSADGIVSIAARPAFAAMLPADASAGSWQPPAVAAAGVAPVPTRAGAWLSTAPTPAAAITNWLTRPRVSRWLSIGALRQGVAAVVVDDASNVPLLTEQSIGGGGAIAVLVELSPTWREGEFGRSFWRDIVRHLVEPTPAAVVGPLALRLGASQAWTGQAIDVVLTAPADASPTFVLLCNGRERQRGALLPQVPVGRRFVASVTPPEVGEYTVRVEAAGHVVTAPLPVFAPASGEMLDVSPDSDTLRRIAGATGGQMFLIDDLARVADRLLVARPPRQVTVDVPIWCGPALFGFIIGCLGLEWSLRKQFGLA